MRMEEDNPKQMEQVRVAFNELAEDHLVRDIIPDNTRFVFVLESPHVQELKYGAPVSGSSGASMSRHLFGEQYERIPLGIMVKKNHDEALHRPSLDQVGLMNVCNIPMQASAYGQSELATKHARLLEILGALRTASASGRYRDESWSIVQEVILLNFRKRLHQLREKSLYIVPCGRFAQKFFALCDLVSPNWKVIGGVPHPSYNNWSKPTYGQAISYLTGAFQAASAGNQ